MKEYGSNVQKLVEQIISIPDKEKRTKHAHILVELMRQIHPQMRDGADYSKNYGMICTSWPILTLM